MTIQFDHYADNLGRVGCIVKNEHACLLIYEHEDGHLRCKEMPMEAYPDD